MYFLVLLQPHLIDLDMYVFISIHLKMFSRFPCDCIFNPLVIGNVLSNFHIFVNHKFPSATCF